MRGFIIFYLKFDHIFTACLLLTGGLNEGIIAF